MRNDGVYQSLCFLVNGGMTSGFRAARKTPRSEGWGLEREGGVKAEGSWDPEQDSLGRVAGAEEDRVPALGEVHSVQSETPGCYCARGSTLCWLVGKVSHLVGKLSRTVLE